MSKLFIRITVVIIALYMIACYVIAVAFSINLWSHTYTVLLEVCICLCMSAQGSYHCKYLRWTMYGITAADALTSLDELFDFIPYTIYALVPPILISIGLSTTLVLSIKHYITIHKKIHNGIAVNNSIKNEKTT